MDKVLLADDDLELTGLLHEYLTEEGYDVKTTADGRDAIAAAVGNMVDLIVLDIMMPRMNGLDVLRKSDAESDPDLDADCTRRRCRPHHGSESWGR